MNQTGEVVDIDDALMSELKDEWVDCNGDQDAFRSLCLERFGTNRRDTETRLLFGRARRHFWDENTSQTHGIREAQVGEMVGYTPGAVLVLGDDPCLTGFLYRPDHSDYVCTLQELERKFHVGLHIYSSEMSQPNVFPDCPYILYWQIGSGQAESYVYLGISPERWAELS